jgi:hypothetical protein
VRPSRQSGPCGTAPDAFSSERAVLRCHSATSSWQMYSTTSRHGVYRGFIRRGIRGAVAAGPTTDRVRVRAMGQPHQVRCGPGVIFSSFSMHPHPHLHAVVTKRRHFASTTLSPRGDRATPASNTSTISAMDMPADIACGVAGWRACHVSAPSDLFVAQHGVHNHACRAELTHAAPACRRTSPR